MTSFGDTFLQPVKQVGALVFFGVYYVNLLWFFQPVVQNGVEIFKITCMYCDFKITCFYIFSECFYPNSTDILLVSHGFLLGFLLKS